MSARGRGSGGGRGEGQVRGCHGVCAADRQEPSLGPSAAQPGPGSAALRELPGGAGVVSRRGRNLASTAPAPGNVGLSCDFVTPELIPWEAET